MGDSMQGEQCVVCGADAAVRVRGTSFCASCGLEHYSAGQPALSPKRRKRAALFGLLSSGLLVKFLLGAAAVAAVGGVAASAVRTDTVPPPVETTVGLSATTLAQLPGATVSSGADTTPETTTTAVRASVPADEGDSPAAAAREYAAAIQAWVDCVSTAASAHVGGPFNPQDVCPDRPAAGDYGLGGPDDAVPPGHDEDGPGNSENAPGHDEDGPGNSENAPGHDEGGPGNSEDAPGHDEGGPGNSENAPGKSRDRR